MNTITLQVTRNCRFYLGDAPDAWQAWFDDSAWQQVTLPHDWSVTLPFDRAYSSGTGDLAGGIGWYRLHIEPDPSWEGKQISITFDGVYKNSRIWCNSYYLGERPNGYTSFTYDITSQFRFDAPTVISVRVDHSDLSDSRWFTGSGITRKVTLRIEEAVHPVVDGIFFSTPQVSPTDANCQITNELINCMDVPCSVTVTNLLFALEGELVYESTGSSTIDGQHTCLITTEGHVENPLLWSPETPSLYTLKTYIAYKVCPSSSDNKESIPTIINTLADVQRVGIRSLHFDANTGFFLNDNPYTIKGVCVHEDAGCLGAAVPPIVWHRRLTKLKKMGCNAIRMSHNPHMPELYSLCDILGFLVIDEAFDEWEAPKNKWSTGHNVYPPKHQGYYTDFPIWHEEDLTALIRRDRNHPSVILWSIGNEIDYPNDPYCHPSFAEMTGNNDANKPTAERAYNPDRPNAKRLAVLAKHLCDIVRSVDTTHPVTLAAAFPELSATLGFIDSVDVVGFNYKEHLYASHHRDFPDKPFLGSENGHSLSAWKAVTDNNYIAGQFLWTGIDYLGEARGWPTHGSGAGLLTLAGFEKTGFYRRQSFWSQEPMVHLATIRESQSLYTPWDAVFPNAISNEFAPVSECWDYIPGESIVVKCYTNLNRAELFLNGTSLGVYRKEENCDCILVILPFSPGRLTARAGAVSHTLVSTGSACQMKLTTYPYQDALKVLPSSTIDTTAPIQQIIVTMLDSNGNPVYHDSTLLHVSVENGRLLGLENGDLSDVTDYTSDSRRAYHGQLLIYAVADDPSSKSEMIVHVCADEIKSAQLCIRK